MPPISRTMPRSLRQTTLGSVIEIGYWILEDGVSGVLYVFFLRTAFFPNRGRMAAASRAMPRTDAVSIRFEVISMSYTISPFTSSIRSIDGPQRERYF